MSLDLTDRCAAASGLSFVLCTLLLGGCAAGGGLGERSPAPSSEYRLYVANESSDIVSRVVFDPEAGGHVEREIPVGIMPADTDGPHGIAVSPDGQHWYVTVAHGTPNGWLWKFHAGPDTLVSRTTLGRFPASVGMTPDGTLAVVANFDLHGDPVPSTISVVHAPDLTELTRVTSCLMPHGSRTDRSGRRHYHVCMHSDQLVELDLSTFAISTRFSVRPGAEGRLELTDRGEGHELHVPHSPPDAAEAQDCAPTWVAPGRGGRVDRIVYVACSGTGQVLEVDTSEWRIERRFDTGPGSYNLEVSPDGRLLVVTLRRGGGISIVDLETGQVSAQLETSRSVTHGVVISPDGRYAFVTNESVGAVPGTLDVFDLESFTRVDSIELRLQPGGVDLWRTDPIGMGPRIGAGP